MTNSQLRFSLSALVIGSISSFMLLSQGLTPQPLQITGTITVPFNDNSMLAQMTGGPSTLYALAKSKTGSEIIRLDASGQLLDRTPVSRQTQSFAIDPSGAVMILQRRERKAVVYAPLFDVSRSASERELPVLIDRLATLGGRPVGVSDNLISTGIDSGQIVDIVVDVVAPHRTVPLADGSLGVIAIQDPTLWKLSKTGSLSAPIKLIAPELDHFKPPDTHVAVCDVVELPNGDFLLAATPYNPVQGIRLITFTAAGRFKSAARVLTPQFPELTSFGGRPLVSKMAIIGSRLFIGSATSAGLRIMYLDLSSE
jgi:hypothetical protein